MCDLEDERLKNFLIYKVYATDDELNKMAPYVVGFVVIFFILMAIIYFFVN